MNAGGGSFRRSERAELDIIECAVYLGAASEDVATRFLQSVAATGELLARTPRIGRKVTFPSVLAHSLRWWPVSGFPNHLMFYREVEDGVILIRLVHGARELSSIFSDE